MTMDYYAQENTKRKELEPKKKEVFKLLAKHKVVKATTRYDGSGDDGQVEETTFYDKDDDDITSTVGGTHTNFATTLGEYGVEGISDRKKPATLLEFVADVSSELISLAPFDWYNNEGGYGHLVWYVKDKIVKFEHNQRIESSEYEEYDA